MEGTGSAAERLMMADDVTDIPGWVYADEHNRAYAHEHDIRGPGLPGEAAVTSIGDDAFQGITGLDASGLCMMEWFPHTFSHGVLTIKDGTATIPDYAYMGRVDIAEVRLPASVVSIGNLAFEYCTGIVALHLPDTLASIGEQAFLGCAGITALHLPRGLMAVGEAAFRGCTGIVDLHLPNALACLGNDTFQGCTGIVALVLPPGLTSVAQGNGSWQSGAFRGCSSLTRVLAPDALARGEMADPAQVFQGCPVLATGLMPHSAIPVLRHTLWHPAMHRAWCTPGQRACVVAVLLAELRSGRHPAPAALPCLAHELWLLILQSIPRRHLGRPGSSDGGDNSGDGCAGDNDSDNGGIDSADDDSSNDEDDDSDTDESDTDADTRESASAGSAAAWPLWTTTASDRAALYAARHGDAAGARASPTYARRSMMGVTGRGRGRGRGRGHANHRAQGTSSKKSSRRRKGSTLSATAVDTGPYGKLKRDEMQILLKSRGLTQRGTKAECLARLVAQDASSS